MSFLYRRRICLTQQLVEKPKCYKGQEISGDTDYCLDQRIFINRLNIKSSQAHEWLVPQSECPKTREVDQNNFKLEIKQSNICASQLVSNSKQWCTNKQICCRQAELGSLISWEGGGRTNDQYYAVLSLSEIKSRRYSHPAQSAECKRARWGQDSVGGPQTCKSIVLSGCLGRTNNGTSY